MWREGLTSCAQHRRSSARRAEQQPIIGSEEEEGEGEGEGERVERAHTLRSQSEEVQAPSPAAPRLVRDVPVWEPPPAGGGSVYEAALMPQEDGGGS